MDQSWLPGLSRLFQLHLDCQRVELGVGIDLFPVGQQRMQ